MQAAVGSRSFGKLKVGCNVVDPSKGGNVFDPSKGVNFSSSDGNFYCSSLGYDFCTQINVKGGSPVDCTNTFNCSVTYDTNDAGPIVLHLRDYTLYLNKYNIRLEGVGVSNRLGVNTSLSNMGQALISVNGIVASIGESETRNINNVYVTINAVFDSNNDADDRVVLSLRKWTNTNTCKLTNGLLASSVTITCCQNPFVIQRSAS